MDFDKIFGNQDQNADEFNMSDAGAKVIFNMFMSFVNAGFEREEALKIVIALMTQMIGGKDNG